MCVFLAFNHNKSSTYEISGSIYGTYWKLVSTNYISDSIKQSIHSELDRIDYIASNYKTESELSLLNKAPINTKIKISRDLYDLLNFAEELNHISLGAYDVTIGSMVIKGGFGPDLTKEEYDLKATKRFMITEDLYIEKYNQFLFDLSSIAKGYAVDRIHGLLVDLDKTNFLIDIGGELILSGTKHGSPWVAGIQNPMEFGNKSIVTIKSNNYLAVATSGEYRNYQIDENGNKTSHTYNPKTSQPVKNNVLSVTVTSKDSAKLADAWATALNVVGPEEGINLAEKHGISVLYIINENNEIRFLKSHSWNH